MEIYNYVINEKKQIPIYFDKESICFMDIETTGLNKNSSFIYLLGMLYFDPNNSHWCITQYFIDSIDKEKILLSSFNDFVKRFKTIITFNGESFDIPFIKYRTNIYKIKNSLDSLSSFDIFRKVKEENSYLSLKNYKLKTMEESLGIYRDDKISGKECIDLYYKYRKNKKKSLLDMILKHNHDDLYYLMDVLKIFDVINTTKTIYIKKDKELIKTEIKSISTKGDMFNIHCTVSKPNNIAYFGEYFNIRWNDRELLISFEHREGLVTPTKKCLFVDVSSWDINDRLKDSTEYVIPDNIILLKVDDKYAMDNLKRIIEELILLV